MKTFCALCCVVVAVHAHAAAKGGADAGRPKTATKTSSDAGTARGADAGHRVADAGAVATDGGRAVAVADGGRALALADGGAQAKEAATVTPAPGSSNAYVLVKMAAPDKKVERLWKAKCGSCHGADGKAETEKGKKMKMTDLSAASWQRSHSTEQVRKAIVGGSKAVKDGVEQQMDAYGDELSTEQLDEMIGYVRYLGAPR